MIRKTSFIALAIIITLTSVNINMSASSRFPANSKEVESIIRDTSLMGRIDNDAFQSHHHIKRLNAEEDLNSYVFLNEDGSKTVYIFGEDLKYLNSNGEIKEKDISLIKRCDGFGIKENNYDVLFPDDLSKGITVFFDDCWIKFSIMGVEACTRNGALQDNSINYKLDAGMDLNIYPTLSGISGSASFNQLDRVEGLTIEIETDQMDVVSSLYGLDIINKDGVVALTLNDLIIYDMNASILDCSYSLKTVGNYKYEIGVGLKEESGINRNIPNDYMLMLSAIIYPQTIQGSNSIQDTPIFYGKPNNNYQSYIYLTAGYCNDTYKKGRVLVNLPGLYNHILFKDATINADIAEVKYYCWDASGHSTQYINLYGNGSGSWHHSSVTWNTAPSYDTTSNYGNNMANASWTAFDITELARSWRFDGSPDRGFILVNSNETSQSLKKAPYSIESNTNSPYVVLTVHSNLKPPHSAGQNKENWCWAACAKRVGQHNGASGTLPIGATIPSNSAGLYSCFGENYYGYNADLTATVDAGQRHIVYTIKGNDMNVNGTIQNIRDALQLASAQIMTTGFVILSDPGAIDDLIGELSAEWWVVGCQPQHVVVFQSFDTGTQEFTYWNPLYENTDTYSLSDISSSSSIFTGYIYCHYGQ